MLEPLKPWLRSVKFGFLRSRAERVAARPGPDDRVLDPAPVAFLIGCGRSGTTVLGSIFSHHPDVHYLFEPYHAWAAIDRVTDCINLYHRVQGRCLMDASHAGAEAQIRFGRLMLSSLRQSGRKLLVEKTPINTMRIGYLDALAPQARFVHIVRDGVDVCRSVSRLATANTYRIAGKPNLNQWWGVDDAKWRALAADGTAAGYYPQQVDGLRDHLARGAYEWLVSLHEVQRSRDMLGERLLELTYPALTADPEAALRRICTFLGLDAPPSWLQTAAATVDPLRSNEGEAVVLPAPMARAFNEFQARFGFANRASAERP